MAIENMEQKVSPIKVIDHKWSERTHTHVVVIQYCDPKASAGYTNERLGVLEVEDLTEIPTVFDPDTVAQQSVSVNDPLYIHGKLIHGYIRNMAAAVSIPTECRNILLLGLGNGSLHRYFNHILPYSSTTSIEFSRTMIEMAQLHFGLPSDSNVIEADAAEWVKEQAALTNVQKYDYISLDCFLGTGEDDFEDSFSTTEFVEALAKLISKEGVFVANLYNYSNKKMYDKYLFIRDRLQEYLPYNLVIRSRANELDSTNRVLVLSANHKLSFSRWSECATLFQDKHMTHLPDFTKPYDVLQHARVMKYGKELTYLNNRVYIGSELNHSFLSIQDPNTRVLWHRYLLQRNLSTKDSISYDYETVLAILDSIQDLVCEEKTLVVWDKEKIVAVVPFVLLNNRATEADNRYSPLLMWKMLGDGVIIHHTPLIDVSYFDAVSLFFPPYVSVCLSFIYGSKLAAAKTENVCYFDFPIVTPKPRELYLLELNKKLRKEYERIGRKNSDLTVKISMGTPNDDWKTLVGSHLDYKQLRSDKDLRYFKEAEAHYNDPVIGTEQTIAICRAANLAGTLLVISLYDSLQKLVAVNFSILQSDSVLCDYLTLRRHGPGYDNRSLGIYLTLLNIQYAYEKGISIYDIGMESNMDNFKYKQNFTNTVYPQAGVMIISDFMLLSFLLYSDSWVFPIIYSGGLLKDVQDAWAVIKNWSPQYLDWLIRGELLSKNLNDIEVGQIKSKYNKLRREPTDECQEA